MKVCVMVEVQERGITDAILGVYEASLVTKEWLVEQFDIDEEEAQRILDGESDQLALFDYTLQTKEG